MRKRMLQILAIGLAAACLAGCGTKKATIIAEHPVESVTNTSSDTLSFLWGTLIWMTLTES